MLLRLLITVVTGCARDWNFCGVARCRDLRFSQRTVVDVGADAGGAFGDVDAVHGRDRLARQTVRRYDDCVPAVLPPTSTRGIVRGKRRKHAGPRCAGCDSYNVTVRQ